MPLAQRRTNRPLLVAAIVAAVVAFTGLVLTESRPAAAATCATNSFEARYYNNTTFSGTPVLTRCENAPGGEFNDTGSSPAPGVVAADNFSADYSGALTFQAQTYSFALTLGNAAGRVYLDGALVIDKGTPGTWGTFTASRSVTAGTHTVRVTWSATTGIARLGFAAPRTAFGTSPGNGNYFAADSPYNQAIAASPVVDSRSAQWISDLNSAVDGVSMNSNAFSTTIYTAAAGTPTATIKITNANKNITIPYRTTYKPSPDSDSHLAVIDAASQCLYEFQSFDPSSKTAIAQATYHVDKGSGGHLAGPSHAGGELSYLAGLITPQDVSAGVIDHALRYAIPTNAPTYVYPGTRSDGTRSNGVPEGTRLQLDPTLDLTPYNLTPFQKMVAKALQVYGAFNGDYSSAFALYARSTTDGTSYALPPTGLPDSLIAKMRFLAPAISSPTLQLDTATDTACAQQG